MVTAAKLRAFIVFAPVALSVPVRPKDKSFTVVVPEEAESVTLNVSAVVVSPPETATVCCPAVESKVPEVGSVTEVAAVEVSVVENAPEVASVEPLAIVKVPVLLETVNPL